MSVGEPDQGGSGVVDGVDAFGARTIQAWNTLITESPEGRAVTQKYSRCNEESSCIRACVGDFFSTMCLLLARGTTRRFFAKLIGALRGSILPSLQTCWKC